MGGGELGLIEDIRQDFEACHTMGHSGAFFCLPALVRTGW